MNCTKKITLTGYQVKYTDLREPKPRAIHEEVYVLDTDGAASLALLGLNVADFITERYARGGYHVTGVERIAKKRVAAVDLQQLWEFVCLTTEEANCQALGNLEVNDSD